MFAEYFENLKHKGEPCTDTSADYRTGYQFDDGMGSVFPPLENEIRTLHENGKERGGEGGGVGGWGGLRGRCFWFLLSSYASISH